MQTWLTFAQHLTVCSNARGATYNYPHSGHYPATPKVHLKNNPCLYAILVTTDQNGKEADQQLVIPHGLTSKENQALGSLCKGKNKVNS